MGFLSDISNLYRVTIAASDAVIYDPPLKALIVSGEGNLALEGPDGVTTTIVAPAVASGGSYPVTIPGKVRRVLAATTVADANVIGLR